MFDARGLHEWLGVGDDFSTWMKRRVREYRFEDGVDYSASLRKNGGRGRARKEYLITIDMAKELSMVERTERGRQTRRYFIEMEKAAREMAATLIEQGFFDTQREMGAAGLRRRLAALLTLKTIGGRQTRPQLH